MDCPNDQSILVQGIYEGDVHVDRCEQCGGVWLDHGELERIQETIERDYSEQLRQIPDRAEVNQVERGSFASLVALFD